MCKKYNHNIHFKEYLAYLKVYPTLKYSKVYINRYLKAFLKNIFHLNTKISEKTMIIKFKGIKAIVRPYHEDLLYYSGAAKIEMTNKWFKPKYNQNIIDIGANVGRYSLIAAKKGANVISIEANPETFRVLKDNIELNNFKNIQAINQGVSNRTGQSILYYCPGYDGISSLDPTWISSNSNQIDSDNKYIQIEVQLNKLDNLIKFESIDWLLIDVEGHEAEVLEGAVETLRNTQYIIIEVEHDKIDKVMQYLNDFRILKKVNASNLSDYLFLENIKKIS